MTRSAEEDGVHRLDEASTKKADRQLPSKASPATAAHIGDDRPNCSRQRGRCIFHINRGDAHIEGG